MEGVPADAVPSSEFYAANPHRMHSRILRYGDCWRDQPWTDQPGHTVELVWVGATRELTARYVIYDWGRLAPGQLAKAAMYGVASEDAADIGAAGRALGDADAATVDTHVQVVATLPSVWTCHRLLWDWRWLQRKADGLDRVKARLLRA